MRKRIAGPQITTKEPIINAIPKKSKRRECNSATRVCILRMLVARESGRKMAARVVSQYDR
jgi:hypothetical protein